MNDAIRVAALARWVDRPVTTTPASRDSILNVPLEDSANVA
jgi:hypothetical protein